MNVAKIINKVMIKVASFTESDYQNITSAIMITEKSQEMISLK